MKSIGMVLSQEMFEYVDEQTDGWTLESFV